MGHISGFDYGDAHGFNTQSVENCAKYGHFTLRDWVRAKWNDVNNPSSPYKYFGGVLRPDGKDDRGDIIYKFYGEGKKK
jgi:hypothetical protein